MEESKVRIPLKKLRYVRKKSKTNQTMVAEFLGVSTQFYSQIERGINVLSYTNAIKIATYFNTTPDILFKDDFLNAYKHLKELDERK